MPRHVSVRDELPVNVASDFAVPPAAVDVNYADHVPLRERRDADVKYLEQLTYWVNCSFLSLHSTEFDNTTKLNF